jgi:2-C-methyl-D-erythritol 4-phosphate cytidylyltransferase
MWAACHRRGQRHGGDGLHPRLVPGGAQNFKVTYPDDFALASAVLAQRGHGTTLERFGGGRVAPTLGG